MEVSINTRKAYSEIDEFLELLSAEQRNKVSQKLREFFKEEKDKDYKKRNKSKGSYKKSKFKRRNPRYYSFT